MRDCSPEFRVRTMITALQRGYRLWYAVNEMNGRVLRDSRLSVTVSREGRTSAEKWVYVAGQITVIKATIAHR